MRAGRARRQLGGSPLTRADSRTLEVKTAIAWDSLYTCLFYRGVLITALILWRKRRQNRSSLAAFSPHGIHICDSSTWQLTQIRDFLLIR